MRKTRQVSGCGPITITVSAAAILAGVGATAQRVEPPLDLPDGWDLADAEKDGWADEQALAWIKANLLEEARYVA
jgi:hypothetical protein